MGSGEEAELTGPLGNRWADFLSPRGGRTALVGGGIGAAPLIALCAENTGPFDFYAGFRTAPGGGEGGILGLVKADKLLVATEDGSEGERGLIPGFLDPARYTAVCACGPGAMLRAVARRCAARGVPCYVSLERRMACGVGACLGCTVETLKGNRRCCADGPIFPAGELDFDE
jgi:NAD(P)H-flavin reductase